MVKRLISFLGIAWLFIGNAFSQDKGLDVVDYVNPLMGTASSMELSNGNTYPAVSVPFGMNAWAPHTGKMGSGFLYTYQSNYLYGFKQTHQPSLWINDYGQFSIMPVISRAQFGEEERKSWFSHKLENATPYYYSAYLADHHATVEIAPTERAAAFRVKYHEADSAYIVIDAYDQGSYIKIIPEERRIVGYSSKNNGGVPANFRSYFVIQFEKDFSNAASWEGKLLYDSVLEKKGKRVGAILGFSLKADEYLNFKTASSFISEEQALINLKEIGTKNFETVRQEARDVWNRELGRIKIKDNNERNKKTFYSCLYRMLIFPRKFYEINSNGSVIHYSPFNGEVLPGYMYTDIGYWDGFRALFPFFALMYPSLYSEIIQGMENTYKESGWLPEWTSPGHRDCMIGSHSSSIITDAWLKGIKGVNIELLYEAIIKNTSQVGPLSSIGRLGHKEYNQLGYIPFDVGINQNVSRTLEYSYNDYCIYTLARSLKRPASELRLFHKRSLNYRNLFDPASGLMRPKNKSGEFQAGFDPFRWGDHFTEANSWQYSWSVFHDAKGLRHLLGGKEKFINKLDSVFSLPPVFDISYYKRGVIHLVREMQGVNMGQYAHGNEPMHHVVYMYNYGAPWKAQFRVREIMDKLYAPEPDGYCGDEDNGQMSAWFVFSAMGIYPVSPVSNEYVIGSPLFDEISLQLENGRSIRMQSIHNSPGRVYINKIEFNNREYTKNYFRFEDLKNGAFVQFEMSDVPNVKRGISVEDEPFSLTK